MCFSTTCSWNPELLPSGPPAGAGVCWVFLGSPTAALWLLCSPRQGCAAQCRQVTKGCRQPVATQNSPTPPQGHRDPVKQHQTTLLHMGGRTPGEPRLRSTCQDCICTPPQMSCAQGAFWLCQWLWWTGLFQAGHRGCLWAPAAIVQDDLLVCIPSSHAHYMSCERDLQRHGNLPNPCSLHPKSAPKFSGPLVQDSAVHPYPPKATESPAPISTGFKRKPSILCLFVDSNYSHGVGNRVTTLD